MATKQSTNLRPKKPVSPIPAKKTVAIKPSLFERMDAFFDRRHSFFLWGVLLVNLLFALLFFDSKVSLSGDDSDYIVYAYNFAKDFSWPGFRGAFYPIVLSPFVALAGVYLVLLKLLSVGCILGMLFFLYKTFYKRIPSTILFFSLILLSFNSYLLFYESQTFSEPLFMLLQALLLFVFCRYFIDESAASLSPVKMAGRFLLVAFIVLLLTLTRTVGGVAVGVVLVYFLLQKQWRNALYSLLTSGVCFGLFSIVKRLLWPESGGSYAIESYLVKDMYNPSRGFETVSGFVVRFWQNMKGYLSRDLSNFFGIRSESAPTADTSVFLTILFVGLFVAALVLVWKKNKPLLFAGLYTLALCFAHFLLLQANWQQERFMLVLYPTILLLYFAGLYIFLQRRRAWQFVLPLVFAVLAVGTMAHTSAKLKRHIPVLQHNLHGDKLYGLTPDWQNFILMSEWAAENLPDTAVIASRKPSISCIYGSRNFTGIYSVPGVSKDTLAQLHPAAGNVFIAIDISKGQINMLAPFVQYLFNGKVSMDNGVTTSAAVLYEVNADMLGQLLPLLNANNVAYMQDVQGLLAAVAASDQVLVYSPDDLYANLQKQRVQYMILANLRINPTMVTGNIINTLQRYLYIISVKYPHVVKQEVHRIGTAEEASLVELSL